MCVSGIYSHLFLEPVTLTVRPFFTLGPDFLWSCFAQEIVVLLLLQCWHPQAAVFSCHPSESSLESHSIMICLSTTYARAFCFGVLSTPQKAAEQPSPDCFVCNQLNGQGSSTRLILSMMWTSEVCFTSSTATGPLSRSPHTYHVLRLLPYIAVRNRARVLVILNLAPVCQCPPLILSYCHTTTSANRRPLRTWS